MTIKVQMPDGTRAVTLTAAQEWYIVNGVNPLHNSGARASVFWACVRKDLVTANGERTPLGNATRNKLIAGYEK